MQTRTTIHVYIRIPGAEKKQCKYELDIGIEIVKLRAIDKGQLQMSLRCKIDLNIRCPLCVYAFNLTDYSAVLFE